ncbi:MAG: hypothetical protein ACRDNF_11970 [Streptosporangiaceae bacterium]
MRDLRVLCLHGYRRSAASMRLQMAPLAATLPTSVELVYMDAPSLADSGFRWWDEGFSGWEHTRDWAIELINASSPIHGLFGFSQGAALAGLLAGIRDSPAAPIAFDFAIMVSGFTSYEPQHADLFLSKLTVPSAHIIGHADTNVWPRDSLLLADRFADPLIIDHAGGHVIPADASVTAQVASFGVALFAYLRMRSGADAIKLDLRVRRSLARMGFSIPPGENALLLLAEGGAEELGVARLALDQVLW